MTQHPSPETPGDDKPGNERPAPTRGKRSAPKKVGDATNVADGALSTLIGLAAHEVPGVVGMAPTSLGEGIRRILGVSQADEGVEIERSDDAPEHPDVVLHVVVAYGVNIPVVAESVMERVRYAARHYGGVEVREVKVHVAGVSRG